MKRGFAGLLICVLALCVTTITAFSTVDKNDMPVNIMAAESGRPQDLRCGFWPHNAPEHIPVFIRGGWSFL